MNKRIFKSFGLAFAVLAGVFLVDLVTPLDMATWVVYLLVPAIASWWLSRGQTIALTVVDTVLMFVGHRFSPPGIGPTIAHLNRFIGVLVLWAVVAILIRHRQTQRILMESEEEFRSLFELSAVGMTEVDLATKRLCRLNRKFCEITGYAHDELLQMTISQITHPEDRGLDDEAFKRALHRESADWTGVKRYVRKDGAIIWVKLTVAVISGAEGRPLRSVGVVEDITKAQKAEEEIRLLNATLTERAIELETVNRELETFNYTVSHDLRKPLTLINSSCQVIQELCGDALSEECKSFVQYINDGTLRMNQMIDALLDLSRMTRVELERETVDLSRMAKEIAAELRSSESERRVTFRITDGVVVNGDRKLLRVLLDNLLGNAWKYTGMQVDAVIEFGMTEIAGEQVCFVRDNGAGFDMTESEKLFLPFHRLSGTECYEGHGIGLATVQRIIERHNGRIWADSEPGKGATFYFTLPADKAA